jgi:RNA polymerase-binding transcription factor DksA
MESVEHPDTVADTVDPARAAAPVAEAIIDLDAIEQDLADVEIALARLDAGTYWTCEETGAALDDALLESSPTARRLPPG